MCAALTDGVGRDEWRFSVRDAHGPTVRRDRAPAVCVAHTATVFVRRVPRWRAAPHVRRGARTGGQAPGRPGRVVA